MKTSVKMALTTGAVAVVGGLFLAGTSLAQNFGHPGMGMGMMGLGHELLKNVDTNKDGALSQDEINAAVSSRLTEFDANHDNQLSLSEFQALWAEISKPISVRAFQFLDPNGDAEVSKQELDDRFGGVVARFDRNGDDMLSPQDHMRRGGHGHRGWRHGSWGHGPGGDDDKGQE